MTASPQSWWPAAALAASSLALAIGGAQVRESLRFEADAIREGEWWRLLSAHLVHTGWVHALMNLASLLVIWALVGTRLSATAWSFVIIFVTIVCSVCLLLLNPQLSWYVGLSGMLHGLLAAGALAGLTDRPVESTVLIAALVAKLAWEQTSGALPGSAALIGHPVIVDAHLYGAVAGALCFPLAISLEARLARMR